MKRIIAILICCGVLFPALAQDVKRQPVNLTLTLAQVADAGEPRQYLFVINGRVAFKTIDGLKKHLKAFPQGSTLTWDPGCDRWGGEPLLSSRDDMKEFTAFCESIGIKFVMVPSG